MAFVSPISTGSALGLRLQNGLVCRRKPTAAVRAVRVARPRRNVYMDARDGSNSDSVKQVPLVSGSVPSPVEEKEDLRTDQEKENDRLRAAEKFIEVNEGKYACPTCDYEYDPSRGEFLSGIKGGTSFADLPGTFICPVCKTPKNRFMPVRKTIAGFAENQQYGFGGNTMTAGQKNGIIFGTLFFFFMILLSGYALN